jgi:hypothetical protein
MKRIFQRGPLLGFETTDHRPSRLPKIGIVVGFIAIFLSFLQSCFSQPLNNFEPGSEPDGFGKIHWVADLTTFKNIEYCRKDPSYGGIEIYRKTGDDSCIGGVATKNIEYLFWKGKFSGICFFEEGFSGLEHLRESVSKEFGEGKRPFTDQEYYLWEGKKTLMALEYNSGGKRILFWMLGVSILRQMEECDKE